MSTIVLTPCRSASNTAEGYINIRNLHYKQIAKVQENSTLLLLQAKMMESIDVVAFLQSVSCGASWLVRVTNTDKKAVMMIE